MEGPKARIFIADSRSMSEVQDGSVALVVTSPPYYHIKDYGVPGQIGYGQSLHEYLMDLSRVWRECWRVLKPGRRLCVNIGDQFARAILYGRYKVIPLHAEVISQCESIGFDYIGAIIWQKKTTMRTTGGAVVMGSFPYPPNGIVELDYEFILLFKKPGRSSPVPKEVKEASRLAPDEWKEFFGGHWAFAGERQVLHEAMFPEELPKRLIRMFSFIGETVLDPFLGSGTTVKVALELGRNAIGYEIQSDFVPVIKKKLGIDRPSLISPSVEFIERRQSVPPVEAPSNYRPMVQDICPIRDPSQFRFGDGRSYRVVEVMDERTLRMDTNLVVTLLGVVVPPERKARALDYLRKFVLGKRVLLRFEGATSEDGPIPVYLYLTNKLFVNRKMIEMGIADADRRCPHRYRQKFLQAEERRNLIYLPRLQELGQAHL